MAPSPSRPDVLFLSYSHVDVEFALRLAADLKNAGARLWMDRLDGIRVGTEWRDAIQAAVSSCTAMIAVLSPDYVMSQYCRRELARADALQRPIFPVLIGPLTSADWPLALEGVQYEDFRQWRDHRLYSERCAHLLTQLGSTAPSHLSAAPEADVQYLTTLVADLESRRGVLEYVSVNAEMQDTRPEPEPEDEWGFAELVPSDEPGGHHRIPLEGIDEAVRLHDRFVLLGNPGAGKTTTLRRLALEEARRRQAGDDSAAFPLVLYLPEWPAEATPGDFVRSRWPLSRPPGASLASEPVAVYLDGLNEMGAAAPTKAQRLREWLGSGDAPARVIVTCRTEDYTDDLGLGALPSVEAQPLTPRQARQFATNYLKERAPSFVDAVLGQSQSDAREAHSLGSLSRNPYMLSALIYVFERSPDGQLPRNMGSLFQKLVRALWKREEARNTVGEASFADVHQAFARLALAEIEDGTSLSVPYPYAGAHGLTHDVVRLGAALTYITLSEGHVRFFHQLMQEYFAAAALTKETIDDIVARLEAPQYFGTIDWRGATKWDQVVVALAGIDDRGPALVEAVADADRELAALCLLGGAAPERRASFVALLCRDLQDENGFRRFVAARTLRHFPDPDAVAPLTAALQDHWGNPRYDVVSDYAKEALRTIGTEDALEAVANAPSW